MFNIDLRLDIRAWRQEGYTLEVDRMVLAYVAAMRTVKRRLQTDEVDFLAMGDNQYLIWACGKCQGLMVIRDIGRETSVQGSDGGQ